MARFQATGTVVRKVGNLTIVFWSHDCLYIKDDRMCYCFHHWYWTKNRYHLHHWRYFVWALKYNQTVTLSKVFELARRHEVTVQGGRMPNLEGKKIIELPSEGRSRRKQQ